MGIMEKKMVTTGILGVIPLMEEILHHLKSLKS